MSFIRLWRPVCRALAMCLLSLTCLGSDYSTTNRDSLSHFWQVAEAKTRPVTILSFGDSMADSYRSITFYLVQRFEDRLGTAGYSLNNYRNKTMINWANGSVVVPPSAIWFTEHMQVPAGGAVWYEAQWVPGGIACDQAGIFFVSQPQGGDLMLSVSTNGGPWTSKLLLSGYSPVPAGHFTNVSLSPNLYRIRVDGLSGTNFIIGPHLLMTQTSGVHVAFMDHPGISLETVTNVPISIRAPVFAGLKPDLMVWHMKEEGSPATSNRLDSCESWWTQAHPDCDVLYIGTPYVYDNTNTSSAEQNRTVREAALQHNRAYVDVMQPAISYDWLRTNELILSDGVHLSNSGGLWGSAIVWNDMGFFALGLPRQLSMDLTGGLAHITFPTASGAIYTLQSSTDLQTWIPELTTPGNGNSYSTNLTLANPRRFYRLSLTPN